MARTQEEKERLKLWMRERFLPVWNGQVDDWESGIQWLAEKTSWTPETIERDILPWVYEWNRQKDLADKKRKFMAELPNVGVFFRKQKWKNPLPYSFSELKQDEVAVGNGVIPCVQCGNPSFNRKICQRCYTKLSSPMFKDEAKETLRKMGFSRRAGESWRDACLRAIKNNNMKVPKWE